MIFLLKPLCGSYKLYRRRLFLCKWEREKQKNVHYKPLRLLSSVFHMHLAASNEKHAFYTQDLRLTDLMSWLAYNRIKKFHMSAQASHWFFPCRMHVTNLVCTGWVKKIILSLLSNWPKWTHFKWQINYTDVQRLCWNASLSSHKILSMLHPWRVTQTADHKTAQHSEDCHSIPAPKTHVSQTTIEDQYINIINNSNM